MTTRPVNQDLITAREWTFKVVTVQLVVVVGLALLLAALLGARAGYSALAGSIISVVPSFYLAARMFRLSHGASAERLLRGIYVGEIMKMLLTVALFVIAFKLLDVDLIIVGAVYLVGMVVHWAALLFPERAVLELKMRRTNISE